MNALDLFKNQQYSNKKPIIKMNSSMRNTIKAVSAPVAAKRDALAERLQSVREIASLS